MITLHPQILKKNGREQFVILPYREFQAIQELLEDADDVLALEAARAEDDPRVPRSTLEEVQLRLGLGPPRKSRRKAGRSR